MSCIATNLEQFLTFTYQGLKFIDSCQFMTTSLAVLAENLRKSDEEKYHTHKGTFQETFRFGYMKRRLLLFIHDVVREIRRNRDSPPIECFYNDLSESRIKETE